MHGADAGSFWQEASIEAEAVFSRAMRATQQREAEGGEGYESSEALEHGRAALESVSARLEEMEGAMLEMEGGRRHGASGKRVTTKGQDWQEEEEEEEEEEERELASHGTITGRGRSDGMAGP